MNKVIVYTLISLFTILFVGESDYHYLHSNKKSHHNSQVELSSSITQHSFFSLDFINESEDDYHDNKLFSVISNIFGINYFRFHPEKHINRLFLKHFTVLSLYQGIPIYACLGNFRL